MPAPITHYLYGVDLYRSMNSNPIKSIIHKNINAYRLGLQGPDIFFFHPFFLLGPKDFRLGSTMHEYNVSNFFYNYLTVITKLSKEEFNIALSYLSGFIAHNTLDSTVHPYIYWKSKFDPEQKKVWKGYYNMHGEVENCIDTLLLKRIRNQTPSMFHISKTIHLSSKESHVLAKVLSQVIDQTYLSDHKCSHLPLHLIKQTFLLTKLALDFLHSRKGIRVPVIHSLENRFLHCHILSPIISWDGIVDYHDAMNQAKKEWYNPWDKTQVFTSSFDELYETAKAKFVKIIPLLCNFAHSPESGKEQLLLEIGNTSYHSGLNC